MSIDDRSDPKSYHESIPLWDPVTSTISGRLLTRELMKNSLALPKTLHPSYYSVEVAPGRGNTTRLKKNLFSPGSLLLLARSRKHKSARSNPVLDAYTEISFVSMHCFLASFPFSCVHQSTYLYLSLAL